jgi:hypothetical protein
MDAVAILMGVVGLVLVLVGVAFVFLTATNLVKEATSQEGALKGQAPEGSDHAGGSAELLAWLDENLPGKLLPGIVLVLVGGGVLRRRHGCGGVRRYLSHLRGDWKPGGLHPAGAALRSQERCFLPPGRLWSIWPSISRPRRSAT